MLSPKITRKTFLNFSLRSNQKLFSFFRLHSQRNFFTKSISTNLPLITFPSHSPNFLLTLYHVLQKFGGMRDQLKISAVSEHVNKTFFEHPSHHLPHPQVSPLWKKMAENKRTQKSWRFFIVFSSQIQLVSLNFCNFHILIHFRN